MKLLLANPLISTILHAATLTGTVVGVSDGDTVTVLTAEKKQHKIRLLGIDAPESKQVWRGGTGSTNAVRRQQTESCMLSCR